LEAAQLNVRERQSDAEDTNLAQAASELQQKQTQLQAALKAVASTKQQASLVNLI
jgi:flagellar hook-associated protein 3 FlgL